MSFYLKYCIIRSPSFPAYLNHPFASRYLSLPLEQRLAWSHIHIHFFVLFLFPPLKLRLAWFPVSASVLVRTSPLEQCLAGVRVGRRTELRHNDAVRLQVLLIGFALKVPGEGGRESVIVIPDLEFYLQGRMQTDEEILLR